MNAVASEFDCGMGRSKMAVRAEMLTGTVMFIHCLAATELVSTASIAVGTVNILVKASSRDGVCATRRTSSKPFDGAKSEARGHDEYMIWHRKLLESRHEWLSDDWGNEIGLFVLG